MARGGGGAGGGEHCAVTRPECAKAKWGQAFCWAAGMGRPGWHRKPLFRVCVEWGQGTMRTTRLLCAWACTPGVPSRPAPQLPAGSCTPCTLPPPWGSGMDDLRGGGEQIQSKQAQTLHPRPLLPPTSPMQLIQRVGHSRGSTPPSTNTYPRTLSRAPQGPVCTHRHTRTQRCSCSRSCFCALTRSTVSKSDHQQRLCDYLLRSSPCPLRFQPELQRWSCWRLRKESSSRSTVLLVSDTPQLHRALTGCQDGSPAASCPFSHPSPIKILKGTLIPSHFTCKKPETARG